MPETTYPYLQIETETPYQKDIENLFDKVKKLNFAHEAKAVLYPLRTDFQKLFIGGGANHIWFHHNENGEMSKVRVGIIHFDSYYGINDLAK